MSLLGKLDQSFVELRRVVSTAQHLDARCRAVESLRIERGAGMAMALFISAGDRIHETPITLAMLIVIVVPTQGPVRSVLGSSAVYSATLGRWLVVTSDTHCVHHSILPAGTNSNFSFKLPWW